MAIRERERIEPVTRRHPVRRVAKWAALVVAVLVVLITTWWVLAKSGAAPNPTITVAAPTTQPAPAGTDGASTDATTANGCLGGTGPDPSATVLAAQRAATLDQQGAAGFALSFLRYAITSTGDLKLSSTLPQLVTPGWLPEATTYLGPTNTRLVGLGGGTSSIAGAPDSWRVVTADAGSASITVTVVMFWSQPSTGQQAQLIDSVILDAADGRWVVAGFAPQPADALAPIAGVPWSSYAGVC